MRLSARQIDEEFLEIWIAQPRDPSSEEAQAGFFQPFFRGDESGNGQGLGLVLHIASEIARALGGLLTVASDATETRFTFTMPLSGTAASE